MKIDLLCSSDDHPINPWLATWASEREAEHTVRILRHTTELEGGDILFLISCTELVQPDLRGLYRHCVVLHASDLPKGRGWSPHIWALLDGASAITVCAINAEDRVDTGDIWAKRSFEVARDALHNEINTALFETEIALLDDVIGMISAGLAPYAQPEELASYYPRRTPQDSELDPNLSIADQFDKIRLSDPNRYPAFFRLHGSVFSVRLRKIENDV